MATNTTNLSLIKPAGTDKVRIAQINQNMDILDEKIGPVGNTSVQNQIDSLNSNINQFTGVPTNTYSGDLNSLLTPGWYLLESSATNTPPALSSGKLKVEYGGTNNYVRQTYYGGYNGAIYTRVRYYSNGWLWSNWQEVTTTIKQKTITGNTDRNGVINAQTTKSHILAVFVTNPINAFAVNEAGNNVRIYAGNNSSTTADTLKMLANTSVTINVTYYE